MQVQLNENRVRCFIEATFGQSLGPGAPREVGQGPFLPSAISNSVDQERRPGWRSIYSRLFLGKAKEGVP